MSVDLGAVDLLSIEVDPRGLILKKNFLFIFSSLDKYLSLQVVHPFDRPDGLLHTAELKGAHRRGGEQGGEEEVVPGRHNSDHDNHHQEGGDETWATYQ